MQLQIAQTSLSGRCLPRLQKACNPARRVRCAPVRAGLGEDLINKLTVAINNSPIAQGKAALAVSQAGQYDAAAMRAKLDALIADNPVVVFSWSGCPFCKRAKAILDSTGARYTALELDEMGAEGKALRAELAKLTGRSSVPNIFIAGKGVGGCNDGPGVATLQDKGELVPMLQAAGAL